MQITNVNVYGLPESIVASGLPMQSDFSHQEFLFNTHDVEVAITEKTDNSNIARAVKRLSPYPSGEGHHCFLAGIVVQFNATSPRFWWPEMQRYHFIDIVSSTSTMHRLETLIRTIVKLEMENKWDYRQECLDRHFCKDTSPIMIEAFIKFAYAWLDRDGDIQELKANLIEGYMQTARITTNYRALKTIYHQRQHHRLAEWREFCSWIESLPMSEMITTGYEK